MALNNMIFFDTNYIEYYSFLSATALNTSTLSNSYDNRSTPVTEFNTTTGMDIRYYFQSGTSFYIDSFILTNHNMLNLAFLGYTGTTWATLAFLTSVVADTSYISIPGVYLQGVGLGSITPKIGTDKPYFGEFIATRKKFQLNYNPSLYNPKMPLMQNMNQLLNGRYSISKRADYFEADIGWDNLMGEYNTSTITDLQNITELIRNGTSFLFWPNGDSALNNVFTYRKQDIFKCMLIGPVSYEFISPAVDYIVKGTGYKLMEIQ